jgi:NAD(P)-dependent dehydrogenase (short-subunit alcohol dehydrogenase family)
MTFAGKTALITGASGNLGKAVAAAFETGGASLALVGSDIAHLRAAFTEGPRRLLLAADLRDAGAVTAAVDAAAARFGRIDILCNIAGGFAMGPPVHEMPDALWQKMFDINVVTVLRTVHAVVPLMLAQGGGKVVNVGAASALTGKRDMGAYTAAKSAVIRFTESMAAELRDKNINVNCVLPSVIDTPQNRADMPKADSKRWVTPEALADVICFLSSDAARAIHGASIPVVGLS